MRNILTVLTLCVLTLTTSSVFAESYDESKRTERFGLSFYDGAPMYLLYFRRPNPLPPGSSFYEPIPGATMQVERLRSGERIEERNGYNVALGIVADKNSGSTATFISYAYDDAGNLVPMESGSTISNTAWIQSLFREQGPAALVQASTGDLGLNVADELFEMAKDIFGEFFPLFAGIFALAAGTKYFEHLAKTGGKKKKNAAIVPTRARQEYFTLEKEADLFSLETPKISVNNNLETKETQRFLDRLAGNDVEETNSVRESYITGARWGREFSEELQESNRRLLNDFEALDDFYRERLIQEFERLSFTQEAGFLKSYRSYAYGVGDDHQNGNPFADESDFAQTPWGGSPFGGGDFEDANRLLDEEYYDSYDGAY